MMQQKSGRRAGLVLGLMAVLLAQPWRVVAQTAPVSQVQVARQFLLAITHGEFKAAYGFLAPEIRQAVTPTRFQTAALPLYQQAQLHGSTIDLYKIGYRLGQNQTARPFVAYTFRADTLRGKPQVQLDVTFRDSTARQVLSFGLVPLRAGKSK